MKMNNKFLIKILIEQLEIFKVQLNSVKIIMKGIKKSKNFLIKNVNKPNKQIIIALNKNN